MRNKTTGIRRELLVQVACWLYTASVIVAWLVMRLLGDRRWAASVAMLFGPRWVWLVPLALLVPLAAAVRRRSLWLLLFTAGIVLFPVMGLCVPWRIAKIGPSSSNAAAPKVRLLTCNVHFAALDSKALSAFISSTNPDIVALQEWTSRHRAELFGKGGWYRWRSNELYVASRYRIRRATDISEDWDDPGSAVCFEIETPGGTVRLVNLHLASPHHQFEHVLNMSSAGPSEVLQNIAARQSQSQSVQQRCKDWAPGLIVAGDFNTPQESPIFRSCWIDFSDAFSSAGWGFGYTYYARLTIARIDHILFGADWRCLRCWVGPDVGSPHRPVIADLQMQSPL
ncbi:MAG: endonuclease/exonuclease/phosphatase family protein [Phycisphaerae bacterium]|nr:endonuclease/exonuclease/phosphatase family protein [Phycisphaerae bacterium]